MHRLQLAVQVILVQIEVVASEDVAVRTRVNREEVGTFLTGLTVSDDLLVPCHMFRDEPHLI